MAHDVTECTKKIRDEFMKADPNIVGVLFKLTNISGLSKNRSGFRSGQYIEVREVKKNRKGEEKEKTDKTFISHDYCPFCGKKF